MENHHEINRQTIYLFEGSRIQQLRGHESPVVNGKVDLLAKKGLEMSKSLAQAEKRVCFFLGHYKTIIPALPTHK